MRPDAGKGSAKLVSVLSSLPLVTDTSGGSRRRAEPASGGVSNAVASNASASKAAESTKATASTKLAESTKAASTQPANASPVVPAPLGNRFQPAAATAQAPTISAHVSAAQRRASDPLAKSTPAS